MLNYYKFSIITPWLQVLTYRISCNRIERLNEPKDIQKNFFFRVNQRTTPKITCPNLVLHDKFER